MLDFLNESIATVTDQKTRAATAAASNELADELIEAHAAYHASTSALNEVCARALVVTQEANGMAVFLTSSLIEVGLAAPIVAEHLRLHARAVLNHQAAAAMPLVPEPLAEIVPVVKEQLVSVFAIRAVKWRDADGSQRCSSKFLDCELPAATAVRALACGAALKLDHPERKKNLGMWPGHTSLGMCFDLDAADASAPQHDPIKHSDFVVTVGTPRLMRVGGTS
jgi:hypothetical protein